jgi:hypothetical protein
MTAKETAKRWNKRDGMIIAILLYSNSPHKNGLLPNFMSGSPE